MCWDWCELNTLGHAHGYHLTAGFPSAPLAPVPQRDEDPSIRVGYVQALWSEALKARSGADRCCVSLLIPPPPPFFPQQDEEPSIRANTTVLLSNIAPFLGEATCKKVLLNAFSTRALKDPFPPSRIAGAPQLPHDDRDRLRVLGGMATLCAWWLLTSVRCAAARVAS